MTAVLRAIDDPVRDAVAELFAGTTLCGPPKVGIELELIPYRVTDRSVVPIDELRTLLDGVPRVSFEPGGQIELNPPPARTVTEAGARLAALARRVRARLARAGVAAVATGVDPWHTSDELGLQLSVPRYVAMDAHFERIGPAGRSFMRRTASTQICVDLAAGDDGALQWRAANLVAPVLAAVFDNSTIPGARTGICRAADPARSRHGDPPLTIEDYVEFAREATPLDQTFAGDRAVRAHLTTLFPPVRPRGRYLEFRALDSLPLARVHLAASLVSCLLASPVNAAAAERICAAVDPRELWDYAAGTGVQATVVRVLAARLVDLARAAVPYLPEGYLPPGTDRAFATLAGRFT